MKIFTLLTLLIVFSKQTYSQEFTLSEMIKINNYNLEEFDSYVNQKGYKFHGNENDDFADESTYKFVDKNNKRYFIAKYFYKTIKEESLAFETDNNKSYIKIKTELKTLGFKYISTNSDENTTRFIYKKKDINVSLVTFIKINAEGIKQTRYEISVSRTISN